MVGFDQSQPPHALSRAFHHSIQFNIPSVFLHPSRKPSLHGYTPDKETFSGPECVKKLSAWGFLTFFSSLPFLLKIPEKVVSKNLTVHKAKYNLKVSYQYAYRENNSTETTLLQAHNDVLQALDIGECVFLVLLDLSVAFNTIDHTQVTKKIN